MDPAHEPDEFETSLPWNTLCAIEVDEVLCIRWQDNSLVNLLSTIHTVDKDTDYIEHDRPRPTKTSTNAAIVRKVLGMSQLGSLESHDLD